MAANPSLNATLFDCKDNPRQADFFEAIREGYKFILYGGAAGGGKSWSLRHGSILHHLILFQNHGIRETASGLFCEDYPTLRDRQIGKIRSEFPYWLGELKEFQDYGLAFRLHSNFGGGVILLRNLDDPSKYDSTEFSAIFVDELTRNTIEVFEELRKRLRWPGVGAEVNLPFVGGTNPGKKGHGWVKRYWITCDYPPELARYAKEFIFIRAKATDNRMNPPGYYADLLSLPPRLRAQMAEGNWDDFEGQFFSEWRREYHVCNPFPIPSYWPRFVASDWGYAKPWCILWFAVSPDGVVYVYREMYEKQMTPTPMMERAITLSQGEEHRYRLLDPACWDSSRGLSIADQCAQAGFPWSEADHDRPSGWTRVREFLAWARDENGKLARPPKLKVFTTCPNVIRTVPDCVHDKIKSEDLDTDGEDHAADTLRYGLMSLTRPAILPVEEMSPEYAEAVMRAQHREKKPETQGYGDLQ